MIYSSLSVSYHFVAGVADVVEKYMPSGQKKHFFMASDILRQRKLNGKMVYYLEGTEFVYENTSFTVVGSEITGPSIYEVNHIVKNVKECRYAFIPMDRLINILLDETCR